MRIETRDNKDRSIIEARTLEMLLALLEEKSEKVTFEGWGDDKTDPDAYIKLNGKKIGIEITQVWGESATALGKTVALERKLFERFKSIKEMMRSKSDWRGCVSIYLSKRLESEMENKIIIEKITNAIVGLQKWQGADVPLPQIGRITLQPMSQDDIRLMISSSLSSDEDNTPFIIAIREAVQNKKNHRYGEHEIWLLCLDRSDAGLFVEDEEIKIVEKRGKEFTAGNFSQIIVIQAIKEGPRGIFLPLQ